MFLWENSLAYIYVLLRIGVALCVWVVSECVAWMQVSKALWNLVEWDDMWMEVCFGGLLPGMGVGTCSPLLWGGASYLDII